MVENEAYKKMMVRMIRAYCRRVSDADESDLADFADLIKQAQYQLAVAARAQADRRSWSHVGAALGMSKQAAFKRFSGCEK